MVNWFRKNDIDFKFADTVEGTVYPHYPPVLAKELKPLKEHQESKFGDYRFPGCPGMHDYARLGYIIPAWTNFHIKANKAGTVVIAGSRGEDALKRATMVKQPQQMARDITDGAYTPEGGIENTIWNCPGAWKIHGYGKVSCLLLPAFFHSNFLDDLYVYPGVVDYNGFTVINFIFSAKRPCEVEIKAGDAFDADFAEAITQIPAPTPKLKGKIVDVIEKGYKLGDKIIRFPKVILGN